MKLNTLVCLLLVSLVAEITAAQIPEQFQRTILANAPQADVNGDGRITTDELKQVYPILPETYQRVIRRRLPGVIDDAPGRGNQPKAKPSFEFVRPAGDPKAGREKGYNCLFMGHSYFVPIVKHIDEHAKKLGLSHHQQYVAPSGGASGSPGRLWTSEKAGVQHAKTLLESGKVELLALTFHYEGSSLKDYRRWVDLALEHNPNTVIVIQSPWSIKNQKQLPEYSDTVTQAVQAVHAIMDELRAEFPDTTFLCVPQGQWMVELWRLFEGGQLPELTQFVGKGRGKLQQALFRDEFGHGGELAEKEGALLWLRVLYGVDLDSYPHSTNTKADLKSLAQSICDSDPYCSFQGE
ncbi:MAG: EF-hand domain-containing protein [Planctomycetota bacterium]